MDPLTAPTRIAAGEASEAGDPSVAATPSPPWQYAVTDAIRLLHDRNRAATSADINQAAGLAWSVYQTSGYFLPGAATMPGLDDRGYVLDPTPNGSLKVIGSQRRDGSLVPAVVLNVRDDLHQVVGIVKNRYRLAQNRDLPRVLDQLVASGKAAWVTAGLLRGGAEVWWLVRLSDAIRPGGDAREAIEFYLLLSHSHDGAKRTQAAVLPLRISSQTILAWPLKPPRTQNLRPGEQSSERSNDSERLLEVAAAYRSELERTATQLIETPLPDQDFVALLEQLFPTPQPTTRNGRVINQRGITMSLNAKGIITSVYYNNPTVAHLVGTLWGALQAVQYYSDHHTISRNTDDASAEENRFQRIAAGTRPSIVVQGTRARRAT